MTTKLEYALHLAEQGFYVFRLRKNGKKPFAEGWQEEATTDRDEITRLFQGKDFNIGVFTGKFDVIDNSGQILKTQALAVVDVDTKDGKDGAATMTNLDIMGFDFPPTNTVKTASGGYHHIYSYPFALSGGANRIGKNVDLKSHGGYIVGAGSTIDGNSYERIFNSHPIASYDPFHVAEAPQWIRDKAGRPMEKTEAASAIHNTDSDQALERAAAYLRDTAPLAVSGAGGNDATFKAAATCHDFGVTEPAALQLLWEHYNPRCQPGWGYDELTGITANAYRYASRPAGISSPHAEFEHIPDDPKDSSPKPAEEFYFLYPDEIQPNFDYYPLIEDLLDQGAVSILYGESNAGKTFVALDMAYHISTGKPWNGKRTTQGNVLYIAAEGGKSAENRIEALKQKYGTNSFPLALMPCAINLFDNAEHIKKLMQIIKAAEAKQGGIRLIVIDTLSRALFGGNENDSVDMGVFVANLTSLRNAANAHVMVVHHSGKDKARGARGHSLLRAAVDTEIEVAEKTITITKQRDMEFTQPIGFELDVIQLGTTPYGKPVTSCVIALVDAEARREHDSINRLDHRDLMAFIALKDLRSDRQLNGYDNIIDNKTWAQSCKDFDITLVPGGKPWPSHDESFRKAFRKARERLVAFGKVVEVVEKQFTIEKVGS